MAALRTAARPSKGSLGGCELFSLGDGAMFRERKRGCLRRWQGLTRGSAFVSYIMPPPPNPHPCKMCSLMLPPPAHRRCHCKSAMCQPPLPPSRKIKNSDFSFFFVAPRSEAASAQARAKSHFYMQLESATKAIRVTIGTRIDTLITKSVSCRFKDFCVGISAARLCVSRFHRHAPLNQ